MKFRVEDSGGYTDWQEGEVYHNKVVMYDEDYDYKDPEDPSNDEYVLPFDKYTVLSMLRSLPKGVRWNPRTEEFEGL